MIQTCKCGKEFLTEADPYLVIPVENYKLNCGCELAPGLREEIVKLNRTIKWFSDRLIYKYGEQSNLDYHLKAQKDFT